MNIMVDCLRCKIRLSEFFKKFRACPWCGCNGSLIVKYEEKKKDA